MKIAVSIIHFLMFGIGVTKFISGGSYNQVIVCLLVIGYGCSGLRLLSIGGQIFKLVALITNAAFVIFGVVGLVYFTVILPITDGLFDKVALIGCLIIGLLGGATIKLLKLPNLN